MRVTRWQRVAQRVANALPTRYQGANPLATRRQRVGYALATRWQRVEKHVANAFKERVLITRLNYAFS